MSNEDNIIQVACCIVYIVYMYIYAGLP